MSIRFRGHFGSQAALQARQMDDRVAAQYASIGFDSHQSSYSCINKLYFGIKGLHSSLILRKPC